MLYANRKNAGGRQHERAAHRFRSRRTAGRLRENVRREPPSGRPRRPLRETRMLSRTKTVIFPRNLYRSGARERNLVPERCARRAAPPPPPWDGPGVLEARAVPDGLMHRDEKRRASAEPRRRGFSPTGSKCRSISPRKSESGPAELIWLNQRDEGSEPRHLQGTRRESCGNEIRHLSARGRSA